MLHQAERLTTHQVGVDQDHLQQFRGSCPILVYCVALEEEIVIYSDKK